MSAVEGGLAHHAARKVLGCRYEIRVLGGVSPSARKIPGVISPYHVKGVDFVTS